MSKLRPRGCRAHPSRAPLAQRRFCRRGASLPDPPLPAPPAAPYQPDDERVVAADSGGVQGAHAVEGAQVHVGAAVLHQELGQVQVALLAGQVERGGAAARPPVHAAMGEGGVQRALKRHLS